MRARSRARGWALQVLYAWEARDGEAEPSDIYQEFLRERRVAEESRPYIRRLVSLLDKHMAEVDDAISRALTNWRLGRLSMIDRNILRIGAIELLYVDDVPAPVSIREAITLAEKYGTEKSPGFVNGVLDALMRQAGGGGADAGAAP